LLLDTSQKSGVYIKEDTYDVSDAQTVCFYCPHKHSTIYGTINDNIALNIASTWKNWMSGFGSVGSALTKLTDSISIDGQLTGAQSFQQPWISRKLWSNTSPLSFDVPIIFTATTDAETDVWKKVLKMAALLFPRLCTTETSSTLDTTSITHTLAYQTNAKGETNATPNATGVAIANVINSINQHYTIPGPSPFYESGKINNANASNGDPVVVIIGNLIAMNNCYIESASIDISKTLDARGFPLMAKITTKVTAMDSNYCNENGDFTFSTRDTDSVLMKVANSISTFVGSVVKNAETGYLNIIDVALGERYGGASGKYI